MIDVSSSRTLWWRWWINDDPVAERGVDRGARLFPCQNAWDRTVARFRIACGLRTSAAGRLNAKYWRGHHRRTGALHFRFAFDATCANVRAAFACWVGAIDAAGARAVIRRRVDRRFGAKPVSRAAGLRRANCDHRTGAEHGAVFQYLADAKRRIGDVCWRVAVAGSGPVWFGRSGSDHRPRAADYASPFGNWRSANRRYDGEYRHPSH